MNHDVTELIRTLRGGLVSRDATRQLEQLVNAVQDAGKKGTMTITLTVEPHGKENREMHVSAKVKTVAPQSPDLNEKSIFFAVRGQLVRDDPQQTTMPGLEAVDGGRADGSSPAEHRRFAAGGNA